MSPVTLNSKVVIGLGGFLLTLSEGPSALAESEIASIQTTTCTSGTVRSRLALSPSPVHFWATLGKWICVMLWRKSKFFSTLQKVQCDWVKTLIFPFWREDSRTWKWIGTLTTNATLRETWKTVHVLLGGGREDRQDPALHRGGVREKHPQVAAQMYPRGLVRSRVM